MATQCILVSEFLRMQTVCCVTFLHYITLLCKHPGCPGNNVWFSVMPAWRVWG